MKYRVLVGLNYRAKGRNRRAEPNDKVTDLPAESIGWLLEQGLIEPVED